MLTSPLSASYDTLAVTNHPRICLPRYIATHPLLYHYPPVTIHLHPQPIEAAEEINQFVWNTTKGRIPTLVDADDVSSVRMVLTNAAFFKGTWLYQFKPLETKQDLFYATPEDYYFVDMMTQKGNFRHGKSCVYVLADYLRGDTDIKRHVLYHYANVHRLY